ESTLFPTVNKPDPTLLKRSLNKQRPSLTSNNQVRLRTTKSAFGQICLPGGSSTTFDDNSQQSQLRAEGEVAEYSIGGGGLTNKAAITETKSDHTGRGEEGNHEDTCNRDQLPHFG
ncbi:hypothetical protein CR513_03348, partial [Mucuna pruriens]